MWRLKDMKQSWRKWSVDHESATIDAPSGRRTYASTPDILEHRCSLSAQRRGGYWTLVFRVFSAGLSQFDTASRLRRLHVSVDLAPRGLAAQGQSWRGVLSQGHTPKRGWE